MAQTRRVDGFVRRFKDLSEDEKTEAMKRVIPEFYQMVMDQDFIQEMMPKCMDMMSKTNFPMKEMMSRSAKERM